MFSLSDMVQPARETVSPLWLYSSIQSEKSPSSSRSTARFFSINSLITTCPRPRFRSSGLRVGAGVAVGVGVGVAWGRSAGFGVAETTGGSGDTDGVGVTVTCAVPATGASGPAREPMVEKR